MKLVEACKQGDRLALGTLVRSYERQVYNAAYRMVGDADQAADITQSAFLKAFEHLHQFDPRFRLFSWIYRITVNESIDRLQRRGRMEPLDQRALAVDPDPAELVDAERMNQSLQVALMQLPAEQRAVLVLRYFTECSYRQIAQILEIPRKTVKSRLFSARQRLKDRLEAMDFRHDA